MIRFSVLLFLVILLPAQQLSVSGQIEQEIFHYRSDSALAVLDRHAGEMSKYRYNTLKAVTYFFRYFADQPSLRKSAYIDSMLRITESTLADEEKIRRFGNSDDLLMLGGAIGFKGMAEYLRKNRLAALRLADDAKELLVELVEKDSTMIDAYFGIGIYNFALAQPPAVLRWLLAIVGFSGDSEVGIAQLKRAGTQGKDTKIQSLLFLINHSIYEEVNFTQMYPLFEEIPDYLRNSPMFLYKRIQFHHYLKMHDRTIADYRQIERLPMPHYIKNRSRMFAMSAFTSKGEVQRADSVYQTIMTSGDPPRGGFDYDLRLMRGDWFLAQGQPEKAEREYRFVESRTEVEKRIARTEKRLRILHERTNGRFGED